MALKALLRRTTAADRWIVLGLLAGALAAFVLLAPGSAGERLVVERDGRVVFTAPLGTDRRAAIEGPLGAADLEIRNGRARLLAAPCPGKVCLGMGPIARRGEIIACVPNHLLLRVDGGGSPPREPAYDLLSR